jgi:hypothetical protein
MWIVTHAPLTLSSLGPASALISKTVLYLETAAALAPLVLAKTLSK